MALFITFEGGEGSGKSYQAKVLYKRLQQMAIPVVLTHEPGVTPAGKKIAGLLKWAQDTDLSPVTELLLFNASRAQLVTEIIKPSLAEGKVVVCDRYADSTTAYQGYGRELDPALVSGINYAGRQGINPDLTVLLDIRPEAGLSRKKDKKEDRFQKEALAFHQRVRQGYLKLAAGEPGRWLVVDAEQSREKIAQIIWEKVSRLI